MSTSCTMHARPAPRRRWGRPRRRRRPRTRRPPRLPAGSAPPGWPRLGTRPATALDRHSWLHSPVRRTSTCPPHVLHRRVDDDRDAGALLDAAHHRSFSQGETERAQHVGHPLLVTCDGPAGDLREEVEDVDARDRPQAVELVVARLWPVIDSNPCRVLTRRRFRPRRAWRRGPARSPPPRRAPAVARRSAG